MNAAIKKRWLSALRGGAYQQGKRYLRIGSQHCCLGVLCEAMGQSGSLAMYSDQAIYEYGGMMSYPRPSILIKSGLSNEDMGILSEANDRHEWTFQEIADWVEIFL